MINNSLAKLGTSVNPGTSIVPRSQNSLIQVPIISERENKKIIIDGKDYNVITVPDNDFPGCSIAQRYKEVVIVDGKQYDVKKGYESGDMEVEYVVVDGIPFRVLDLNQGGGLIYDSRFPLYRLPGTTSSKSNKLNISI